MEFSRAFSFQFKDPDWIKKIILVALISLIPVIGQIFAFGWGLEIIRRVIRREPEILPEIDFGTYLGKGWKAFLTGLVYSIPLIIFYIFIMIGSTLGGTTASDSNSITSYIAMAVSVCCGGLMLVYSLVLLVFFPAALGILADRESVGAALKIKDVVAIVRSAPTAFLIVAGGEILASIISQLGVIACFIGAFVTGVYALTVIYHLTGQAYREAMHI
jgi:hypothetical protein